MPCTALTRRCLLRRALGIMLGVTLVASLGSSVVACEDKGEKSAAAARADVTGLVELANKDVAEIERGLPEGAAVMADLLRKEDDPKKNPAAVRSALLKMRRKVADLGVAKSTFFAFADEKGIAIRNDLEQDTMAGKDVVGAYPELKKVLSGASYVATQGQFPGAPNPQGPDKEWVAAVPVKKADGTLAGVLVTGWTYRRFAYHLQVSLKRELQDKLLREGDHGKLPVLYVFLFDKDHAYGARGTPAVNEKVLEGLHLTDRTASGPASGALKITDRAFGWAAARVPKLGPDVGIVVLRSEI